MRCGDHVRSRLVDLGVDAERRPVHGPTPGDHVAVVIDLNQIGHRDVAEVHAEGVHPKRVSEFRVADRDVSGHPFRETESPENPERSRQLTQSAFTLLRNRFRRCGTEPNAIGGTDHVCG
ncbi:Uncharacterised protein [Mycobacteroides abscessus subsp. massiliense]|nr:Uncharacterised protein [Mycobacteroides abscessus subsp. massiliense]SKI03236.1 Uncharacterised protein [Mycobacteroides abscessus subsp. massiliense]